MSIFSSGFKHNCSLTKVDSSNANFNHQSRLIELVQGYNLYFANSALYQTKFPELAKIQNYCKYQVRR